MARHFDWSENPEPSDPTREGADDYVDNLLDGGLLQPDCRDVRRVYVTELLDIWKARNFKVGWQSDAEFYAWLDSQ